MHGRFFKVISNIPITIEFYMYFGIVLQQWICSGFYFFLASKYVNLLACNSVVYLFIANDQKRIAKEREAFLKKKI